MSKLRVFTVAAALVASTTFSFANECSATHYVEEMDIGCDGEALVSVSLGKCDFPTDKVPNVSITSVIDGRGSNVNAVTVETTQAGSFVVKVTPQPRGNGVCKVENFVWVAE